MQNQHGRVRQIHAALDEAAGGDEASEQNGDRRNDDRIVPREERDEDAGEAIARGKRGVGASLNRGDLEKAGEPGAGPRDRRAGDDQLVRPQSLREGGAKIAAVMRAAKPKVVRSIRK